MQTNLKGLQDIIVAIETKREIAEPSEHFTKMLNLLVIEYKFLEQTAILLGQSTIETIKINLTKLVELNTILKLTKHDVKLEQEFKNQVNSDLAKIWDEK